MLHAPEPPTHVRGGRHSRALVAIATTVLLGLTACTDSASGRDPNVVDLVQQNWQHVPGVSRAGDGLRVAATGLTILHPGGRQPNPAVDLTGTHLLVTGDFALRARFTGVTGNATWAVYDKPPVIADEFRIEPAGLRLTLRGHDLAISVFDGSRQRDVTDPRPARSQHVTIKDPKAVVSVSRTGKSLAVASGRDVVSTMSAGTVFTSGELWLGLSSDDGSFTVPYLTASGTANGSVETAGPVVTQAGQSSTGLQALASRVRPGFRVGAAVALGPLASDLTYARELTGNFGAITPENAMKAQFLSPRRGVYTFAEADALVAIAKSKGMTVHGHTIAFTEAMPRWMLELPTDTAAHRRASGAALLGYLTTVVKHFRGKLASLDVVNEPFDVDQGTSMQKNPWYRAFGPGYPAIVSKAVYKADPGVKQFINENGADVPGDRQDALLKLARNTNAAGGHVYGVGLQAHVYNLATDAISATDLSRTLSTFGRAKLHVRISENDVTDDDGTAAQARQYTTVLQTCLRSPVCVSYTTWGVDDRYDWFVDDDGSLQQGHDLLFDEGRPTPALTSMKAALRG